MRDEEAGDRTVAELGGDVEALTIDVEDPDIVRAAASLVDKRHGRLDVLVNNAGVLLEGTNPTPGEIVDLAMIERTFRTNVLGTVAVLEAFLPLLRRSEASRIVNVSSRVGSLGVQPDPESPFYATIAPAYQSSKAAWNKLTIVLAKQLNDTPIKVTSVCPGFVKTDITP